MVVLLLAPAMLLWPNDVRAATAPFTVAFHAQTNGGIVLAGNSLVSCPASVPACLSARNGAGSVNNNDWPAPNGPGGGMTNVNVDPDTGNFNSSSADLVLPAGSTVLFARLYWGARANTTTPANPTMRLRTPASSSYTSITASFLATAPFGSATADANGAYQAWADVTALVQSAGAGTYWGANVVSAATDDRFAGWALVVAFQNPGLPLRDLTVFNGFQKVGDSASSVKINVSGFVSPPFGSVRTQLGMVAYEGDLGTTGDTASLNGTPLSSATTPRNNFFNSTDDLYGASTATRSPSDRDMFGFDIKDIDASGILPNGATSATITATTTGDTYYPGVVTTVIDLYAPSFSATTKSVVDVSGHQPAQTGDTLEYTIAYTNTGLDTAARCVSRDPLPPGVTYVPGSIRILTGASAGPMTDAAGDDQAEYDPGTRTVRARLGTGANAATGGTLDPGDSTSFSFRVTIDADAAGTTIADTPFLDYVARTIGTPFTHTGNTVTTPVTTIADLSLTKSASPNPVAAGGQVTWTLTVTNLGPNGAPDALVTDALPGAVVFVSATPSQGTCAALDGTVTCRLGTVASGATATIAIVTTVDASDPAGTLADAAQVTSDASDPDPADNVAGATAEVNTLADLGLTKTLASAGPVVPGTDVDYTVTATDNGPSDAQAVTITDALTTGLTFVSGPPSSAGCTASGRSVSCPVGALAAGASATVTIRAHLDSGYTASTLPNSAQVSSLTVDPNPANNTATTSTPVGPQADLRLGKSASPASPTAGGEVVYTLTVANAGPSDAAAVVLTEPLPAGLTFVGAVTTGSCTLAGATVTCSLGTLPAGASTTVTITAAVSPSATGSIANTASVSSSTADPNTGNNAATASVPISSSADLAITKVGSPNPVVAGGTVTYTITVTNHGPSDSTGVVVSDALPAQFALTSATPGQGTCAGGPPLSCALGTVAPGATATVTVVMAVPSTFPGGDVANTATVTATTRDPDQTNNGATFTLGTGEQADLQLTKAAGPPSPAVAGTNATFTLTVHNAGPSAATGVELTDPLPAGLTLVSATPSQGTCAAGPPVDCSLGALAAGADATVTLTVHVGANLPRGSITNTASVTSATPDPTSSNNRATAVLAITDQADVSITKSGTPNPVLAGNLVTYTLTAHNAGPSDIGDFTAGDILPTGLTAISATSSAASCTHVAKVVECLGGALASGASATITVVARVDSAAAPGTYSDTAVVGGPPGDRNIGNNFATFRSTVQASAAISIVKAVTPDPMLAGATATYALTVSNAGPSDARAVTVTDPLPAVLTLVAASTTSGTCAPGPPVSCAIGTLGPGRSATVTLLVRVGSGASGPLPNTATASTTTPGNGTASATITAPVVASADLALAKTASPDPVPAGGQVTYVVLVTNAGPSDAADVTVTDPLPAGAVLVPEKSSPGCAVAQAPTVTCALGTLAPSATATVTIVADVAGSLPAGQLSNTASVSSTTPDPEPGNNSGTAAVAVTTSADLSVTKVIRDPPAAGLDAVYVITVTNNGPSDAQNVALTDLVPADSSLVSETTVPRTLAAGQTATIVVTVAVSPHLRGGAALGNIATASSDTTDPDLGNNSAADLSVASAISDLSMTKSADPAVVPPGGRTVFTMVVSNPGPSDAAGVTVADPLPAGLVFDPSTSSAGCVSVPAQPTDSGAVIPAAVMCGLDTVPAGARATVVIGVTADPSLAGTVVSNVATVFGAALDPVSADATVTVTVQVAAPPSSLPRPPNTGAGR